MRNLRSLAGLAILAALILSGCQIAGSANSKSVLEETVQAAFMQSAMIEGEQNLFNGLSKATLPDPATPIAYPTTTTPVVITRSNYPESGQSTKFTISKTGTAGIYTIVALTSYTGGVRDTTTESYYVKDMNSNDQFDNSTQDLICDKVGTPAPKLRQPFTDTLWYKRANKSTQVKSNRLQTITLTWAPPDNVRYGAFAIGGSMAFDAAFAPAVDSGALWSSKVGYTQSIPSKTMGLDTILGTPYAATYDLVGTRYYTETPLAGSDRTCSSIYFETVKTPGGTAICESVTRTTYDILGGAAGYKTVMSRTLVHGLSGDYTVDLSQDLLTLYR
jgi:hypothetical protein